MRLARLLLLLAALTVPTAGPVYAQRAGSQSAGEIGQAFSDATSAAGATTRRGVTASLRGDQTGHGVTVPPVSGVAALLTSLTLVAVVWRIHRTRRELPAYVLAARVVAPPADSAEAVVAALGPFAGNVAVLDRHGTILAVNDAWSAFAAVNGVRDLTTIGPGTNYLDLCARAARAGSPDAAAAHDAIEAVCSGRRARIDLDYRGDGPDESVWFRMTVRALRGGQGAVVAHHDVTAPKRDAIVVRERELSMLVDALPVAIKIVDASGLGRHFNTTWLRMTGRTLEDELHRQWIERGHPDDRSRCARAYQRAVESRQPLSLEYRVRRQDGSYRWLLDHVMPRYDDDGQFVGLVSAALDITDRRLYEERLRDLTGRLVTAQEDERRRIARELHDDVNQRMALLAIGIDQVLASAGDEGVRDSMGELLRQATEISRAVHDLSHDLHSSTLEALGLVPAVRTLSRELSTKGLQVNVMADDDCRDLPPPAALALFRIVQESLSNVLKHSGATEAVVTLRQSQDTVVVRVADRGQGFNPAMTVDGLGLHSMRERLTPIGGDVQIRSRPGEGTTVEARVPRLQGSAAAPTCAA